MYDFYEKPTCPNRVIQKETALASSSIGASLNQEVVRRLLNCHSALPLCEKQNILSEFAQKLLNSGHSLSGSQLVLVHGTSRYLDLVRKSELPTDDPQYKPLHYGKNFKKIERKLSKHLNKTGWYEKDSGMKSSWRNCIPEAWRGPRPAQFRVHGLKFTSVFQVPSSNGSRLLRELAKVDPRLSKLSGYHIKLVEKSGRPLSKFFNKDARKGCHRSDCLVSSNDKVKGPSLCQTKNVVYECVCVCVV